MKKEIMDVLEKDNRFSFEGNLVIRKERRQEFVYDKQGNLLEKTYADGSKYVYNKQGNLLEKTYADGSKDVYNKQGNLLEKTYADGSKDVYKFGIKIKTSPPPRTKSTQPGGVKGECS